MVSHHTGNGGVDCSPRKRQHLPHLHESNNDEVQKLRRENEKLREELVSKMRGSNKYMSGGQFKGSQSMVVSKPCSACAALRLKLQDSRGTLSECKDAKELVSTQLAGMNESNATRRA